jgi:Family of unknown function (DUF5719)
MKTRRGPAFLAILAVLVAAWVVDSRVAKPRTKVAADVQTPMAARAGSRSSAWFCTGVTAAPDAAANGTVVVANAGNRALNGTVTVVPSEGDTKQVNLSVMAHGRTAVKLTDVLNAPYASALVELDGGQAAVEVDATGPLGESVSPCASAASTTWYLAEGVTTKDAAEVITLFNPFPEDAVVDMVFTTEEGEVTPQALTGLSVKGQGMTAINVGDNVERREAVSARITARAGRLIAGRLQTFDGSNGRKGMAVNLAAPAPGDVWYFPEGYLADGLTERYQLFNPTAKEAKAELDLTLEQGSAEPIVLTVPPESRVTMTANDEARIPKSVAHAVTVRSTNGVPLVAERTIDATTPNTRSGLAITLGAPVPAPQWILAAGQVDDSTDSWLVVQNAGSKLSRVTVTMLDDGSTSVPPGLNGLNVGAGQRRAVHLSSSVRKGSAALVVTADQPVVVEGDFYNVNAAGTAMAAGIPQRQ